VLAVCGFSGSGKTTLLEAAIPRLVQRGLAVAVVKHDAHGFDVDRPGKDSDRLFRAGATVSLRGPEQQFERRAEALSLEVTLARLGCDHDLLLVEGHKDTALPKIWLGSEARFDAPQEVTRVVASLAWNSDRLTAFLEYIDRWYPKAWKERPLHRGLLLGGRSARMGQPKQTLQFGGRTLGEIAAEALCGAPDDSRIVVLGMGALPAGLRDGAQLPDAPGFAGPGAGMISAHRWAPEAAWIVAACDHPWLLTVHVEWLAAQRQPGRWAVIPKQRDGHPCPTFALYEPQALEAMERRAWAVPERNADPSALLAQSRTLVVQPPPELADGWTNVNTPEELRVEEERLAKARKSIKE
jgi:molybdopterin-guanine dinucleotide biosynthesis protein A